jgi:hypothetical protein
MISENERFKGFDGGAEAHLSESICMAKVKQIEASIDPSAWRSAF